MVTFLASAVTSAMISAVASAAMASRLPLTAMLILSGLAGNKEGLRPPKPSQTVLLQYSYQIVRWPRNYYEILLIRKLDDH
jgi:hypothetical protein